MAYSRRMLSFSSILLFVVSTISVFAGPSWALHERFRVHEAPPLLQSFQPADEIALQAALSCEATLVDPDLNRTLRSIDIRTALEDTARLRGELG